MDVIGRNRPTLKLLNKLVKVSATKKWYDLGVELLAEEDVQALDEIQSNYPRDASTCCTKMFQLWLDKQPEASWRQLIEALGEPNIELKELANAIEQKLITINEGLVPQASVGYPQSAVPQQSVYLPITFTQDEPIDQAFTKLSASVTGLIQNANFHSLQRACIEKAKTPKMLLKSNEIVPVIKEAQSFQALCSMLADTTYWNFLDIRMMEAMATASMIPAAQEAIENFKKIFFSMTLKEAAPYFPIIPVKPGYVVMHEALHRDPSQMTIGELYKHRFYLETEIIQTGPDTCTICSIRIGSVTIEWQIHLDHIEQAYSSIKSKRHSQLSLQAISNLSVPEAAFLEARLPLPLHGQEIKQIGPIEQITKHMNEQRYPLPEGFEWCSVSYDDCVSYGDYENVTKTSSLTLGKMDFKWITSHLQYKSQYLLGVRISSSKKLVSVVYCVPYSIIIGGKMLSLAQVNLGLDQSKLSKDVEVKLWIAGYKEIMKNAGLFGISQSSISCQRFEILKPVISFNVRLLRLKDPLPYDSTRTAGLRRIRPEDVPRALVLTNQYASQFKIGQVFQSEEEFSHWFLCPSVPGYVTTYVVEDPVTGDITDMFSFRQCVLWMALIQAMIITKSPVKQLMIDLSVCLKQQGFSEFSFALCGINKHVPAPVYIGVMNCYYLYNYQYPEINEDDCCLFGYGCI